MPTLRDSLTRLVAIDRTLRESTPLHHVSVSALKAEARALRRELIEAPATSKADLYARIDFAIKGQDETAYVGHLAGDSLMDTLTRLRQDILTLS